MSRSPQPATHQPAAPSQQSYRNDLDGLRGIAITLVACFHIWFGRVSGGVDVFLTLSGYFFVASLLRHVIATTGPDVRLWTAVNPGPRLWRLARRLLPALILVLLAIVVLTMLVMPRTRWTPLGSEVIASALYYQNWHLAFASQNYDQAGSANSPMQHLWSMSVQGQFFVLTMVCALLLGALIKVLAARGVSFLGRPAVIRAIFGIGLGAVALVSLYWANMRHGVNQPFNYYDTIARTWEPLAGGLLAIWMPRITLPNWVRNALGITALGLIATCGWWIDGVEEYPGIWALVPVGATLLLIWSGAGQTVGDGSPGIVSRVLAGRHIVWLGSIAYALYLWHWPLLIFYLTWRYKEDVSFVEGTLIIAVSLVLAWATTRFVEKPLRAGSPKRASSTAKHRRARSRRISYATALTAFLVVSTLVAGTGITLWQRHAANMSVNTENLDPRLYPGARAFLNGWPAPNVPPQPSPEVAEKDWPIGHSGPNPTISGWDDPRVVVGRYGDVNATRNVALVGGSHAEYWLTALNDMGKKYGFKVTTYLKVGCALVTDTVFTWYGKKRPDCNVWSREVMRRLATPEERPDVVFTNSTRPNTSADGDFIPGDYVEVFKEFARRDQKVIAVRDNPWTHLGNTNPPECIGAGRPADQCGVPRKRALNDQDPAMAYQQKFPEAYPTVSLLDYSNAMCTPTYCPAVVGNVLVWHDDHHLTTAFVRSLIPALSADMRRILNWW